jgi:hypothetical protein
MSIPIAFAFDLTAVLADDASAFVPGNFAKTGAAPLVGDDEFDKLPFSEIYHDGGLPPDKVTEVNTWRMSEVVVPDALGLENLSFVICRTIHEERTLRHLLASLPKFALPKIIVEQKESIFMRRGIFIDEIYWQNGVLHFLFHHPISSPQSDYEVHVEYTDQGAKKEQTAKLAPGRYQFPGLPASADAVWRIEIEGCIVYHAKAPALAGVVP